MRDYIISSIHFMVLLVFTFFVVSSAGIIKIEKNYYNEYQSCKTDLKESQKSIQCPEVKCTQGIIGIMWSFIGFFVMLGGFLYFNHTNKQLDERRKELDLRESQINAQKSTKPSKTKGA